MDKMQLLSRMLKQVASEEELRELPNSGFEGLESVGGDFSEAYLESAERGINATLTNQDLAADEAFALEAIIMPKYRPVVDVINRSFARPPEPWEHLGDDQYRERIEAAIPSIGRIELPEHPRLPFGGTGFVVGRNLIMTNRHVAEIFAQGLGVSQIGFKPGHQAGIDFAKENSDNSPSIFLDVVDILMIHPFWDMAILEVSGLDTNHPALKLSVEDPRGLEGREIAVVGYPAQDARNDLMLQLQIFRHKFDVKRMQPGKLQQRELIVDGFRNRVNTLTHDSSTLGGNSGSALIDVTSGEIVGLHFGGRYLVANYAVPTFELARDQRVVDLGLKFSGSIEKTNEWESKWREADSLESNRAVSTNNGGAAGAYRNPVQSHGEACWTIPLQVSVSVGTPQSRFDDSHRAANQPSPRPTPTIPSTGGLSPKLEVEGLKVPIIHEGLEERDGYDPAFLELDGDLTIQLPSLSAAGKKIAATLEDGSHELHYHRFTIVMHKKRRLALFTIANVDWRDEKRRVNGKKPTRKELTGLNPNDQEQWVTDPRLPEQHQLPDVFFTKDRASFDKGHLVRRDEVCWGESFEDIQMANGDTFHTTNCSPQVAGFNRSKALVENWGSLETLIEKQTKAKKSVVIAGPVFQDDDPVFKGKDKHGDVQVLIPRSYWKIIVIRGDDGPEAFGFVLEQDLSDVKWEMAVPEKWKHHMKPISELNALVKSNFSLLKLKRFDQFETAQGEAIRESLSSIE